MPAYAVTLPYGPARTLKEGASVAVLFAATVADAKAAVKDLYADGADAQWANATVTEVAAALSFAGWNMNISVFEPDADPLFSLDICCSVAVAATGTLTFSGVGLDTQTVTTGSKVYTLQTVLTNTDGNVLIGANQAATVANLVAAINLAAGAGTTYAAATTANTHVSAVDGAGDTVVLTALVAGAAGNSIATTETCTNASFGSATLTGGADGDTVDAWGVAAATALNAYAGAPIQDAAYNASTNVLTVAGTANDDLGDHSLVVKITPPDRQHPIPSLVGAIVHEGVANAVLSVALPADNVGVPQAFAYGRR